MTVISINHPQPKHKYVSSWDAAAAKKAATPQVPVREASGLAATPTLEALDQALQTDPLDGWDGKTARGYLRKEWVEFVGSLANWTTFVTLTFEEEKYPDVAWSLFRWWVRLNNEYVFGKHYTRTVGHSYFSYVVGIESQKRDVLHFHVLVDKPIKYALTHEAWGDRCGYAWIDGEINKEKTVEYLCKYVTKGGEVNAYRAKKDYTPNPVPRWWKGE